MKPKLDCSTRWNSTYFLIQRALRLRAALTVQFEQLKLPLDDEDWKSFTELDAFFNRFDKATNLCCADKYPTLSLVVPIYNVLMNQLSAFIHAHKDKTTPISRRVAAGEVLRCLKRIVHDRDRGPRLKLQYYDKNSGDGHQSSNEVKDTVAKQYKVEYEPPTSCDATATSAPVMSACPFDATFIDAAVSVNQSELDDYFILPVASRGTDPLNWWRDHESRYPTLSHMAKDYLAIPGTSASSKRLFLSGRQTMTDYRPLLDSETMRDLMCLKTWLV